ncbi:MAG TPA: hypothetical protein V6C89_00870 [Drouetiella sp.]|jgi:hypothetical protein
MVDQSEKQKRIEAQIAQYLANGYKREELIVTQDGSVIYDPAAAEAQVFANFDKKKSQSKSSADKADDADA